MWARVKLIASTPEETRTHTINFTTVSIVEGRDLVSMLRLSANYETRRQVD